MTLDFSQIRKLIELIEKYFRTYITAQIDWLESRVLITIFITDANKDILKKCKMLLDTLRRKDIEANIYMFNNECVIYLRLKSVEDLDVVLRRLCLLNI